MNDRQQIPPFVWGYSLALGSLLLAAILFLLFQWLALIGYALITIGSTTGLLSLSVYYHKSYNSHKKMVTDRQTSLYKRDLVEEKLKEARHKNEVLAQLPALLRYGVDNGMNVSYMGLNMSDWRSNVHTLASSGKMLELEEGKTKNELPLLVSYNDIRESIPEGHNLVGIGEEGAIITKEDSKIGACVWIVGLSGTGKTSSTSLRVEERYTCGHKFLGIDPHWFKDDSLTNAIVGYSESFLMPIARTPSETIEVLDAFLTEFSARKGGYVQKPFQKITLIVDEVNSFMDPSADKEMKEIQNKLKVVSRICGQEARNFMMGGIFISQRGTGLYWLRNVALLIIVHKLLMENEQKVATNLDDKQFFKEMRLWPRGRTYVYGCGLEQGEGCITLQQPHFQKEGSGEWKWEDKEDVVVEQESERERAIRIKFKLSSNGLPDGYRDIARIMGCGKDKVAKLLRESE